MKITAKEGEKKLINKVVRFTYKAEENEIDFDNGMLARIKNIIDDGDSVYSFLMDFSEFEDVNIPLMKANYYDNEGNACETWAQQPGYSEQREKGAKVYLSFAYDNGTLYDLPFEIAEDNFQPLVPTLQETLDALERTLSALKQRNLGKPYACLDEVFEEANHVLKKGGREPIS